MKKMGYIFKMMVLACALTFSPGCSLIQNALTKDYVKKTDVVAQIDALNKKHDSDLKAVEDKISGQKDTVISRLDGQLQTTANTLYGASEPFILYTAPTRLDYIIHNHVTEAQAVVGKSPTAEAIATQNEDLKKQLDEKQTTLAQLQQEHQQTLIANTQLASQADQAKKDLEIAKAAELVVQNGYIDQNAKLQKDLKTVNDNIQADLVKKAADAASIEKMKMKMIIICGAASLLALLGAIYSPIFKEGLIIIAVVLGGIALAIPFIQSWMIVTAGLVILAGMIVWFLYKHNIATKAAENAINTIEEAKTKMAPEAAAALTTTQVDWNTKYAKDGSAVVKETDPAVDSFVSDVKAKFGKI